MYDKRDLRCDWERDHAELCLWALDVWGNEFPNAHNNLVDQVRALVQDENNAWDQNDALDIYVDNNTFIWKSRFTCGRYIKFRRANNGATLEVKTGTGRPSTFFGKCALLRKHTPHLCAD